MTKKYALFGVAAVIAVAGIIYFGTGANQQASVANVVSSKKTSSTPLSGARRKHIEIRGKYCVVMTGRHVDCINPTENGMCPAC